MANLFRKQEGKHPVFKAAEESEKLNNQLQNEKPDLPDNRKITVIRSRRKSIAVEITPDLEILVRAPLSLSSDEVEQFVRSRQDWIESTLQEMEQRREAMPKAEKLTDRELRLLSLTARRVLPPKVAHYARMMGVSVGRITIRCQKTRWGSCTVKGDLNFNCLLMLAPEEVQDYIVVHELAHRLEMNHSSRFWAEVERVLPDYRERRQWLNENGTAIMSRRPAQNF